MKITQHGLSFIIAYSSFLYSAESNSSIVKTFDLPNCIELSFLGTRKVVAITKDTPKVNGYSISLENNTIQEIFSDSDEDFYSNHFITINDDQTKSLFSSRNYAIVLEEGEKRIVQELQSPYRPTFKNNETIIFTTYTPYPDYRPLCKIYNCKQNTCQESISLTNAARKVGSEKYGLYFGNQILKLKEKNEYILLGSINIFPYNEETNQLEMIRLLSPGPGIQKDTPLDVYDIQLSEDESHLTFTDNIPYKTNGLSFTCWILNLKDKKYFPLLHNNEDYQIDSKVFIPIIPPILATLLQMTGEIKYWNTQGECLVTQNLGHTTEKKPFNPFSPLLSVSSCGTLITCTCNNKVFILKIPNSLFEKK